MNTRLMLNIFKTVLIILILNFASQPSNQSIERTPSKTISFGKLSYDSENQNYSDISTKMSVNSSYIAGKLHSKKIILINFETQLSEPISGRYFTFNSSKLNIYELNQIKIANIDNFNSSLTFDINFWFSLNPGVYTISVLGQAAGYVTSSINLSIEKLKDSDYGPEITLNKPEDRIYDYRDILIEFKIYDDFLIREIGILLDNDNIYPIGSPIENEWGTPSNSNLYMNATFAFVNVTVQAPYSVSNSVDGLVNHIVKIRAIDSDGNETISSPITYKVDGELPSIDILTPDFNNEKQFDNNITITLRVKDKIGKIDKVSVLINLQYYYFENNLDESDITLTFNIDLKTIKLPIKSQLIIEIRAMDTYGMENKIEFNDLILTGLDTTYTSDTKPITSSNNQNPGLSIPQLDITSILSFLIIFGPFILITGSVVNRFKKRLR
jgi:hypothetical protein